MWAAIELRVAEAGVSRSVWLRGVLAAAALPGGARVAVLGEGGVVVGEPLEVGVPVERARPSRRAPRGRVSPGGVVERPSVEVPERIVPAKRVRKPDGVVAAGLRPDRPVAGGPRMPRETKRRVVELAPADCRHPTLVGPTCMVCGSTVGRAK